MKNGTSIFTVSKLLGHASVKTTEHYIHWSKEYLNSEYKKIIKKI
ncbi:hypothetical protein [Mycoplasma sp. (ex Biomphalaria glabrata)]|nr:hypothetical protein [Mycoplasma sp. (ex Biomphalaria glabrata)]